MCRLNHINQKCLSQLHPDKFPILKDINTQSAEQTNRIVNKHKHVVRQKPGSFFRFYNLRVADLLNSRMVRTDRSYLNSDERVVFSKDPAHRAHAARYKAAAEKANSYKRPDVPDCYLGIGSSATHVNVVKFKEAWDTTLSKHKGIIASSEQGVAFKGKEALRRELMDFAVMQGIVQCIDLGAGMESDGGVNSNEEIPEH